MISPYIHSYSSTGGSVLSSIENVKFWPYLANMTYFVTNFGVLDNAVVYQINKYELCRLHIEISKVLLLKHHLNN